MGEETLAVREHRRCRPRLRRAAEAGGKEFLGGRLGLLNHQRGSRGQPDGCWAGFKRLDWQVHGGKWPRVICLAVKGAPNGFMDPTGESGRGCMGAARRWPSSVQKQGTRLSTTLRISTVPLRGGFASCSDSTRSLPT